MTTVPEPPDEPADPDIAPAKQEFRQLMTRLARLTPAARARWQSSFAQELVNEVLAVDTPAGPLSFVLLGRTSGGRATKLLTRQPATIAWIDRFRAGTVLWDIGANIGSYALYAAKRGQAHVVAFEPAAINYFLLAANAEVNGLDERMDCLLVGLGGTKATARLHVSQFDSGRSFSFLGKKDQPRAGRQTALVLSMDELVEEFAVPVPTYVKIDTPGMTEAIIEGGTRTLRRPEVEEIHIELPETSKPGQRVLAQLREHGFAIATRDTHGGSTDITLTKG